MHRIEGENVEWSADSKSSFKTSPPYTVMTPEWANAVQEEIMYAIEQAGLPILGQNNDTRQQLYDAMRSNVQSYDYFVNSQQAFVNLFERTGANAYRIKSDYSSVFVKKITGGYSVAGILSGGDTWGDISTNACEHLEFQNGAYISFAAMKGNLTVDTDGCYLHNVDIRGNGVSSVAVESFKLNAYRVTFDNCKCSNRLSTVAMTGFQGSATAAHNYTSKYVNCMAYTLDGVDELLYAFKSCHNLSGCCAYDLDVTNAHCYVFYACTSLSSCAVSDIEVSGAAGQCYSFYNCNGLSGCSVTDVKSNDNVTNGFYNCHSLSGCYVHDFSALIIQAFKGCHSLSACKAVNLIVTNTSHFFDDCYALSGCSVENCSSSAFTTGFDSCFAISGCYVSTITAVDQAAGFYSCGGISGCQATNIVSSGSVAYGFYNCIGISSCTADTVNGATAECAFRSCNYGAALYSAIATNTTNDWIDTVDATITNKVSTPSIWT